MDRILKLQEATGNSDITFTEADLQADFDPENHDQRMQACLLNLFTRQP